MFSMAKDGTLFNRIFNEKINKNPFSNVDTLQDGLQKAKTEKYAFVYFDHVVNYLTKSNCDLFVIPYVISTDMIGIVWGQNSTHGQFFEHFIKKLDENGVLDKMAKKHLPKPRSDCGSLQEFVSMGFSNTISAFAMLFVSSLVALSLFVFECLSKYWKNPKILILNNELCKLVKTK